MQNNDKNLITSIQVIELDDDALESVAGGVNVGCANYDCPEDVKIDIDVKFP